MTGAMNIGIRISESMMFRPRVTSHAEGDRDAEPHLEPDRGDE